MRTSTLVLSAVAVGVLVGGFFVVSHLRESETVPDFVASKGLEEDARSVAAADARLTEQIARKLGLSEEREPQIDFSNPSEADIRFLIETFDSEDSAARRSAAKALILIQESRAVALLARATGTPDEEAFFCAGALEILRFKTREQAAALMIELLEDPSRPVREGCRAELAQKFQFIRGDSPEVLVSLLERDSQVLKRYAIEHLPPMPDEDVRKQISTLAESADTALAGPARRWLEKPIPDIPAGTSGETSQGEPGAE